MTTQTLPLKKYKILLHVISGIILVLMQAVTLICFGWSQAASTNQLYSTAFYFFISASLPIGAALAWYHTAKGHHKKAFFFYLIPLLVYLVTWGTLIIMSFIKS